MGINSAFDNGSDKIWDAINKGVRVIAGLRFMETNSGASGNGRTSSTDT
jgi:hypothetical protein